MPRNGVENCEGKLEDFLHDKPFATDSYRDVKTSRPYFANVVLAGGHSVMRHPPPGLNDLPHQADSRPGLWLAFGSLSWHDKCR